ncbi:hypothetical protein L9F63_016326, partial [Diploptera punctata]
YYRKSVLGARVKDIVLLILISKLFPTIYNDLYIFKRLFQYFSMIFIHTYQQR